MSLGETEIFLLQTILLKDFIMESALTQLEMNQTLLESEIPDIEFGLQVKRSNRNRRSDIWKKD